MPTGEVGAGDITDLAASYQGVQGVEGFLYRGGRVESVKVVDVDVVRSQTFETRLAGMNQVMTAGAEIVWALSHGEGGFGGDQNLITAAGNGLTQNLFRHPL